MLCFDNFNIDKINNLMFKTDNNNVKKLFEEAIDIDQYNDNMETQISMNNDQYNDQYNDNNNND